MSENIVETLVNTTFEVGKLSLKALYKLLHIEPYYNLEQFFKDVGLKNKQEQYPKTIKVYESKKGYTYLFSCPLGIALEDFKKYKGAIEIQLREKIDIRERRGYIEVEVITKKLPTKIEYNLPTREKDSIYIPFAESSEGTLYLDLKHTAHVLCTGSTGGGKSVTTRNIITSLINLYPNEVDLYCIDFKIVELSVFKNLRQTKCYVNEVEEAKEVICDLMEECKRRYRLFEELEVNNIYDYNKKVSKDKRLKYQFIVIEEFVMLLEDRKKVAMTNLKKLASLSRASGQFLYITGQRFDNTVIDLVLRANIGNRLCHKVESENDSKLIIDTIGAEKLRGDGHLLAKLNGQVIEGQSYYISDEQVKEYIKPYIQNKALEEPYKKYKDKIDIPIVKDVEEPKKANNEVTDLSFLDNI